MTKEKQIKEMTWVLCKVYDKEHDVCKLDIDFGRCDRDCRFYHNAEMLYNAGYRKQSDVVKEFVKRFEKYIGNCTFTLGQTNDIQYALKKAAEDMRKEDEGK